MVGSGGGEGGASDASDASSSLRISKTLGFVNRGRSGWQGGAAKGKAEARRSSQRKSGGEEEQPRKSGGEEDQPKEKRRAERVHACACRQRIARFEA